MKYDRRIVACMVCIVACIVLLCVGGVVLYRFRENDATPPKREMTEIEQKPTPVSVTGEPSNMAEGEYFLRTLEGEIVVYYNDKETIFDKTGIDTSFLGESERERLKEGYFVENEESLYALLESYSS